MSDEVNPPTPPTPRQTKNKSIAKNEEKHESGGGAPPPDAPDDRHVEAARLFAHLMFGAPILVGTPAPMEEQSSSSSEKSGTAPEPSTSNVASSTLPTAAACLPVDSSENNAAAKFIASLPLDQIIPPDHKELRQTALFQTTFQTVQGLLDSYLVGNEYAAWRGSQRQRNVGYEPKYPLPFDETALGHQQLSALASDFIPSPTVQDALRPLLLPLPKTVLLVPTVDATVWALGNAQPLVETAIKSAVVDFLSNPDNRISMKRSTQGYIANYRDTP